jgi:hypothetical protein
VKVVTTTFPKLEIARITFIKISALGPSQTCPMVFVKNVPQTEKSSGKF